MADKSFLAHFITEDIYVLKEELPKVKEETPAAAPVGAEAPSQPTAAEPVQPVAETAAEPVEHTEEPVPEPVQPTAVEPETEKPAIVEPVAAEEKEAPALFEPLKAEEPEPVYLKPLPTLGKNLKHCLVLVESDEKVLENNLKALLGKIMTAINRTGDDILLVNVKNASEDQVDALLTEQNHRHLFAFGTHKVQALMEVGNYELTQINRKVYLKADSLKAISENLDMKKALWKALKEMF